jgi:hypothetical protein
MNAWTEQHRERQRQQSERDIYKQYNREKELTGWEECIEIM